MAEGKTRATQVTEGFTQTLIADSAVDIIKRHDPTSSPLFLWTAFTAPHTPLTPNPPPHSGIYEGKTRDELAPPTFPKEGVTGKDNWADYYEAITALDEQVGRITKAVEESRLSTNTLIVFLGDNGYMMGSRGWSGKVVPYDGSIRVPFIMWGAPVTAKGKTDATASSLDLPPTFVKLAGAEPPDAWPGRDLRPVLADGKPHGITYAISEFPDPKNHKFGPMNYRTIRTTESKLILWEPGTKPNEFYDLANDPHETKNLYGDPSVASKQNVMQDQLRAWMALQGDNWSIADDVKLADNPNPKGGKKAGKKARRAKNNSENNNDD